jgi:hypothetical protein
LILCNLWVNLLIISIRETVKCGNASKLKLTLFAPFNGG